MLFDAKKVWQTMAKGSSKILSWAFKEEDVLSPHLLVPTGISSGTAFCSSLFPFEEGRRTINTALWRIQCHFQCARDFTYQ